MAGGAVTWAEADIHFEVLSTPLVPVRFYARDAEVVAPALLGMLLCRDGVVLRIAEVEAYRWPDDTACHARHGRTARNDALWGPPGRAYIYLCYGLHHMLNLVTGRDGEAGAVLVRAAEPVAGLETVRTRRRGGTGPALLAGPGRLGAALALDLSVNGERLFRRGGLEVRRGTPPDAHPQRAEGRHRVRRARSPGAALALCDRRFALGLASQRPAPSAGVLKISFEAL